MCHHLHPQQTGLGWMSILEPKTAQQARKKINATQEVIQHSTLNIVGLYS